MIETLNIIIELSALFLAIILHELAHGYVALLLDDKTAHMMGRLSLNPARHVDPIGTIIFPAILHLSGANFIFGWAKPVPVNYSNFKNPKRDVFLVASAGIAANILLFITFGGIALMMTEHGTNFISAIFFKFCIAFSFFNIMLAAFNLLPIPPLDGSKMFLSWIKKPWIQNYLNSQTYGLLTIILLGIIIPEVAQKFNISFNPIKTYLSFVLKLTNDFLLWL
ncbi:MAG: site-2 protease family protein [Alphaproteobacteria bacterium]|nr:site-2 protease family protein [Alphaproteobacteria bacterium]